MSAAELRNRYGDLRPSDEDLDWNAIGALAELIGALAVIASLVYLASQVREGSRALQTTMRDSAFHSLAEWNYAVMADTDLCWVFQEGCRNFDVLDEKQKARFLHAAYSFFKIFENLYLHTLDGSIEPETWEHNRLILQVYGSQPGAQSYIEQRLPIFDPRFRQFLAEMGPPEIATDIVAAMDESTSETGAP